jgi:hypothetical protein
MMKCYDFHHRECPYEEPHPLIMEKIYFDFRKDFISMIDDYLAEINP